MGVFTMTIKEICEALVRTQTDKDPSKMTYQDIISTARPIIFNFNYPYYGGEQGKEQLENKIIYHYYMDEIGLETIGLWQMRLQVKLQEEMPRFVEMFNTQVSIDDPYITTSITESRQDTETQDNKRQLSGDYERWRYGQNVPQNNTGYNNLEYISRADKDTDNHTETNVDNNKRNSFGVAKREGMEGHTKASIAKEYFEIWQNIDKLVIDCLSDLFMQIRG